MKRKNLKEAFKLGYVSGRYDAYYSLSFIDETLREKIVQLFEDMSADAIARRHGGEQLEKLLQGKHSKER